ncbi:MAG: nicotinate-nucleotide adenylyltransferase [Candidatus Ancaeobacter aquaticus]|nr:nicotinate-nucleotide adenylyltransferase [Candidatus Ancaeobacter aquaticus]
MKICLFGGTFNPIHNGHLYIAQMALEQYRLGKVIFIPAYIPPHKRNKNIIDPKDRMHMIRCSIKGNNAFTLSDIEIVRGGTSYSVDTLRSMKKIISENDELFFLMGTDSMADFHSWHQSQEIVKLCKIISYERPGCLYNETLAGMGTLKKYFSRSIKGFPIAVSSSDIRKRIKNNINIKYIVPEKAEKYIKQKGLYL